MLGHVAIVHPSSTYQNRDQSNHSTNENTSHQNPISKPIHSNYHLSRPQLHNVNKCTPPSDLHQTCSPHPTPPFTPDPARIHRTASQKAPARPRSPLIHTKPRVTNINLQPALLGPKRLPHPSQIPPRKRPAAETVRRRPHVLDRNRASHTDVSARSARHTATDPGPPPAQAVCGAALACAAAVREEVPSAGERY